MTITVPQKASLDTTFSKILEVVQARGLQGKAVVSYSTGRLVLLSGLAEVSALNKGLVITTELSTGPDALHDIFIRNIKQLCERFFYNAHENGIIFVVSAGNNGMGEDSRDNTKLVKCLGDAVRTVFGDQDSEFITVSGTVYADVLFPLTSPRGVTINGRGVESEFDPRVSSDAKLGCVGVYAPAINLPTCDVGGRTTHLRGTSPASDM